MHKAQLFKETFTENYYQIINERTLPRRAGVKGEEWKPER
jgi:hypothetical protein